MFYRIQNKSENEENLKPNYFEPKPFCPHNDLPSLRPSHDGSLLFPGIGHPNKNNSVFATPKVCNDVRQERRHRVCRQNVVTVTPDVDTFDVLVLPRRVHQNQVELFVRRKINQIIHNKMTFSRYQKFEVLNFCQNSLVWIVGSR